MKKIETNFLVLKEQSNELIIFSVQNPG